MKNYIGTKRIKARPMTRGEYNRFKGWEMPGKEIAAEDWYIVE